MTGRDRNAEFHLVENPGPPFVLNPPLLVALDGGTLGGMPDVDAVWARIRAREGEQFRLVRGARFVYAVEGSSVVPDRTEYPIARSEFAKALELVPLRGPGEIQHLRGPSYVYAIISDPRISAGEW